jgi:epsilon-lactone hydrolase
MENIGGTMVTNADTDALVQRETSQGMVLRFLPEAERKNPLVHIIDADPTGLPPMYILAGGYETLLDNATRFADNAKKVGVDVELEIAPGMQHVYTLMAGRHELADKSIANVGEWLKRQFAS